MPIFISRMERIHFDQDSKAGGDQDGEIISSTLGEQGVTVHARKGFDREGGDRRVMLFHAFHFPPKTQEPVR